MRCSESEHNQPCMQGRWKFAHWVNVERTAKESTTRIRSKNDPMKSSINRTLAMLRKIAEKQEEVHTTVGKTANGTKGGKRAAGNSGEAKGPTCWKCDGRGHVDRDCPSACCNKQENSLTEPIPGSSSSLASTTILPSEMLDAGHPMIFEKVGGFDASGAAHEEWDIPMMLVRRNGVCKVNWDIVHSQHKVSRGKTVLFRDMPDVMPSRKTTWRMSMESCVW